MSPLYRTSREKKPSLGSFDASNKSSSGLLIVAWRINYYAEQPCSPSISLQSRCRFVLFRGGTMVPDTSACLSKGGNIMALFLVVEKCNSARACAMQILIPHNRRMTPTFAIE